MLKSVIGFRRFAIFLAAIVVLAFAANLGAQEAEGLTPANVRVDNIASVQRGARIYFNYCAGCHLIKYMSYSRLSEDLKLSPDEVLSSFAFTGAKIGDQVVSN